MTAHPVIEVRPPGGPALRVVVDRRLEVGRECDGVLLADELVSRRHLAVWAQDGTCMIEDQGSRNGTTVNGRALEAAAPLGPGDVVCLGNTELQLTPLVAGESGRDTAVPAGDARATVARSARSAHPGGDPDGRATAIGTLARLVSTDSRTQQRVSSMQTDASGTLTFLFSDIESSTELAEELGDHRWYEVLSAHNELIEREVAGHRGTVVKSLGDGHLCTFPTARDALLGAAAIQRALQDPTFDGIAVRMGLHTGEAIAAGGDIFGLHVNVAARVAARAEGGQVLVSSLTRSIARTAGDLSFGPPREVELKGRAGTYEVSELLL